MLDQLNYRRVPRESENLVPVGNREIPRKATRSMASLLFCRRWSKGGKERRCYTTRLVTALSLLQPTFLSQRFGNNNIKNSTKSGTLKNIKDAKSK